MFLYLGNNFKESVDLDKNKIVYFNEILNGNIPDDNETIDICSCEFSNGNIAKAFIFKKDNKKYYKYELLDSRDIPLLESKLETFISNEGFIFEDYFTMETYEVNFC